MPVVTEYRDRCLVIRLARPEMRNSLSIDVIDRLNGLVDDAALNKSVEKIIFIGTDSAFASGADLREIRALTAGSARHFAIRGQTLMSKIASSAAFTVAAINGFCFGGGLDLALACDRRIASSKAVFSHPGVELGIITAWGGTQRLPKLIGTTRAMEMLLTAERVSAPEALRIRLIDELADNALTAALKYKIEPN